ncbi:hypothetical protein [Haloechinothrix sp. LS1_15]|uniref:hypothetical protein n=1 Tax=Haloechinothrix sp. LS1_15 TaxID=2652248 RepID=UPI002945122B|nr:hypothetical protein [Haloechinothrix sp. LS1_15]MDV6013589.1 hypothetical protein [Haloechinothrix sp. LS1_15]
MRKIGLLPALALAATVAACGGSSPQDQWAEEVENAGIQPGEELSYEQLYDRAEMYCDFGSEDEIAMMVEQMLDDENETSLLAPDADHEAAAQAHASATWTHACGEGEDGDEDE